jgi:hypothetical protein
VTGGTVMEPFRLRSWRSRANKQHRIYTCARPGRSKGTKGSVPDSMVDKWISGLPGRGDVVIVSLLGSKPDGTSEFKFYSFYGSRDEAPERSAKLSFQEWINKRNYARSIRVIERPTRDLDPVPEEIVATVSADIRACLDQGTCVVLMDSGGITRTGQVSSQLGYAEDSTESPFRIAYKQ